MAGDNQPVCETCQAVISKEEAIVLCPTCFASLSPEHTDPATEYDHRGLALPRRSAVGGIITPV